MTIGRELTQSELHEITGGGGKSLKCIAREVLAEVGIEAIRLAVAKGLDALSENMKSKSSKSRPGTPPIQGHF